MKKFTARPYVGRKKKKEKKKEEVYDEMDEEEKLDKALLLGNAVEQVLKQRQNKQFAIVKAQISKQKHDRRRYICLNWMLPFDWLRCFMHPIRKPQFLHPKWQHPIQRYVKGG